MNQPSPSASPAVDRPPAGDPWSGNPTLRTTVSFLLFLHLFALAVAVASNVGPVSPLRREIRQVPFVRPYLQLLDMDLGYNFHLTYAGELDTDHFVQIERDWRGQADAAAEMIQLPPAGTWPRIRARRFHNLALTMAEFIGDDELESVLPHAVGRAMLIQRGVTSGIHRLRCRRHFLLTMADVASLDPVDRDPLHPRRYGTAYEADLSFYQGELILTKAAGAAETAPVQRD